MKVCGKVSNARSRHMGKHRSELNGAFKRVAAESCSGSSTRPECYTTSSTMAEAAASYNTVGNGRAINSYNFYRIGGELTGRGEYCESFVPRLRLTGLWNSCSLLRRAAAQQRLRSCLLLCLYISRSQLRSFSRCVTLVTCDI